MTWQDVAIGIGQFVFTCALIPSIFSGEKPHRWTCAMTASILFIFAGVYLSLGMWIAAASVLLCGACWSILLFQERKTHNVEDAARMKKYWEGA